MLSPLTVAVFSATPPTRAGLGSSVANTTRQIGVTVGIAVLGAFVLQQFAINIASQLAIRGVPGSVGATIASKIASAGAQASQVHVTGRLSLTPIALHQAINQAFVDALHGAFLISGILLLATALLVGFVFPQKQRATRASVELTDSIVPTEAGTMQSVDALSKDQFSDAISDCCTEVSLEGGDRIEMDIPPSVPKSPVG